MPLQGSFLLQRKPIHIHGIKQLLHLGALHEHFAADVFHIQILLGKGSQAFLADGQVLLLYVVNAQILPYRYVYSISPPFYSKRSST